mmetsp:Transcript_71660/g.207540  ORF Transcript_71660/g.207540 Transcript_71660/m.207540 type:complete len:361 (+) Transcript_71660:910-1992(+)
MEGSEAAVGRLVPIRLHHDQRLHTSDGPCLCGDDQRRHAVIVFSVQVCRIGHVDQLHDHSGIRPARRQMGDGPTHHTPPCDELVNGEVSYPIEVAGRDSGVNLGPAKGGLGGVPNVPIDDVNGAKLLLGVLDDPLLVALHGSITFREIDGLQLVVHRLPQVVVAVLRHDDVVRSVPLPCEASLQGNPRTVEGAHGLVADHNNPLGGSEGDGEWALLEALKLRLDVPMLPDREAAHPDGRVRMHSRLQGLDEVLEDVGPIVRDEHLRFAKLVPAAGAPVHREHAGVDDMAHRGLVLASPWLDVAVDDQVHVRPHLSQVAHGLRFRIVPHARLNPMVLPCTMLQGADVQSLPVFEVSGGVAL